MGTASRAGNVVTVALSITNDGSMRTDNAFSVSVDVIADKNISSSTATSDTTTTTPTFGTPMSGKVPGVQGNQDRRFTFVSSARLTPGASTDLKSTITLLNGATPPVPPTNVTITSVDVTFVPGNGGGTTTYPVTVTSP